MDCAGGAVYSPLTDSIMMVEDTSYMFVTFGFKRRKNRYTRRCKLGRIGGASTHSSNQAWHISHVQTK